MCTQRGQRPTVIGGAWVGVAVGKESGGPVTEGVKGLAKSFNLIL